MPSIPHNFIDFRVGAAVEFANFLIQFLRDPVFVGLALDGSLTVGSFGIDYRKTAWSPGFYALVIDD